jgi:hypothetical protein
MLKKNFLALILFSILLFSCEKKPDDSALGASTENSGGVQNSTALQESNLSESSTAIQQSSSTATKESNLSESSTATQQSSATATKESSLSKSSTATPQSSLTATATPQSALSQSSTATPQSSSAPPIDIPDTAKIIGEDEESFTVELALGHIEKRYKNPMEVQELLDKVTLDGKPFKLPLKVKDLDDKYTLKTTGFDKKEYNSVVGYSTVCFFYYNSVEINTVTLFGFEENNIENYFISYLSSKKEDEASKLSINGVECGDTFASMQQKLGNPKSMYIYAPKNGDLHAEYTLENNSEYTISFFFNSSENPYNVDYMSREIDKISIQVLPTNNINRTIRKSNGRLHKWGVTTIDDEDYNALLNKAIAKGLESAFAA